MVQADRLSRNLGVYTPLVATPLTSDQLDRLTRSIITRLRPLAASDREIVLQQLVDAERLRRARGGLGVNTLAVAVRRDSVM